MIDVLILNYNDSASTIHSLEYLKKYNIINTILIVDNCSCDDSFETIQKHCIDNVKIIRTKYNGGYGMGNNVGLKYLSENSNSKYVLLANPDTFITYESLKALFDFLKTNDDYAIAAPFMCDKNGKKLKSTAFRLPEKKEYIFSLDTFKAKLSNTFFYRDITSCEEPFKTVGALAGSLFLLNIEKMMKTGLYDEKIFLYCEEVVLGMKLQRMNYKSALLCNEVFIHNHSVSIDKTFASPIKKRKILNKSKLYVIKKYYNATNKEYALAKILASISIFQLFLVILVKKISRGK